MDIISNGEYPSGVLSNFYNHHFEIDGVMCSSMEGFLQSLKFKDVGEQIFVCGLHGPSAKEYGRTRSWKARQTLFWLGQEIDRHSDAYATLLDRAFASLALVPEFRTALLDTGTEKLTHSIGSNEPSKTILTEYEFCDRLTTIREYLRS